MDELGLNSEEALTWFPHVHDSPYVLIRVNDSHARAWANKLGIPIRRCYITDTLLEERAAQLNRPMTDLIAAKLPDPGATMAGDFGEILVYLYLAARNHTNFVVGPKKWRLKQDRTKPAPLSDVIHFLLPSWPTASENDALICSEVKTKSTDGASTPIKSAIEDSAKDRTSRLARTLVWLRERALIENLGNVTIEHIERFIKATDNPPATKHFCAVAVICASLVGQELTETPSIPPDDYSVVVISIPDLRQTYMDVFEAARRSIATGAQATSVGVTR